MDNFRTRLFETGAEAGINVLPIEKCIQLIAWLYVYGGGQEIVTSGGRLTAHILYAQKMLKIDGTEIIDPEIINGIKKRVSECYQEESPEWLKDLCVEYGIKASKGQEEAR